MSYSLNAKCGVCESLNKCKDVEKVNEAIYKIHTTDFDNHLGNGIIQINCTNWKPIKGTKINFYDALNLIELGIKMSHSSWDRNTYVIKRSMNVFIPDIKVNKLVLVKQSDIDFEVNWSPNENEFYSDSWNIKV